MAFSDVIKKIADNSDFLSAPEKDELYLEARRLEQSASAFNSIVVPGTTNLSITGMTANNAQIVNANVDTAAIDNATITNATIDTATITNGTIDSATAGSGEIVLDTNGITITAPAAQSEVNALKFKDGSTLVSDYSAWTTAGENDATLELKPTVGNDSYLNISCSAPAGKDSSANMTAQSGSNSASVIAYGKTKRVVATPNIVLPSTVTPTETMGANNEAQFYIKGSKFVVRFNDAGTEKYFYLDLTATTDQSWIYSATAI